MNVMPVTRSGLTIGSCDTLTTRLRERLRIELMPIAAAVPMTVAMMLDANATSSVRSSELPASPENTVP